MTDDVLTERERVHELAARAGYRCMTWTPDEVAEKGPAAVRTDADAEEIARLTASMIHDMTFRVIQVEMRLNNLIVYLHDRLHSFKPSKS